MGLRCLRTAYFSSVILVSCVVWFAFTCNILCTLFDRHVRLTVTGWMPVAMGIGLYGHCFDWLRYVIEPAHGVLS